MANSRLCSIPDCGKRHFGHGYCSAHYERWRKHGDPRAGRTPNGDQLQFFRDVVLSYDGDECLIWPFPRPTGYAKLHYEGRKHFVSRLVCEHVNGPPPPDRNDAAHTCGRGNDGCIAKRHLVWKTRAENMADAITHGTSLRGNLNPNAILTEDTVREIKRRLALGHHTADIARQLGTPHSRVRGIKKGDSWRWV